MDAEFYFLTSRKTGKHVLYIQINPVVFDNEGCYLLRWDVSFQLNPNHPDHSPIIDILAYSVEKNCTREEREPIIDKAWALIKKLPGLCYQYLPDHLLVRGKFSPALDAFYRAYDKKIEQNPQAYIRCGEPYTAISNVIEYQIISAEICSKFLRVLKEDILFEISQEYFEEELSTFDLRQAYVQYLFSDNRYYCLSYDFPGELGWTDMLFIMRQYYIPFFLFRKSPLNNLFTRI